MIKQLKYRNPGSETLKTLNSKKNARSITMYVLERVNGMCAWCNEFPVRKKNAKYCDRDCGDSAMVYCYPQNKNAKGYMLLKQNFKCALCPEDFSSFIESRMKRYHERFPRDLDKKWDHYSIGCLIASEMDSDHKVAIVNGGSGFGVENIHLICKPCHKKKTNEDMRLKREREKIKSEEKVLTIS